MAEIVANLRMEYGPNKYTLYRTDEVGDPQAFSDDKDKLSFVIARMDDSTAKVAFDIEEDVTGLSIIQVYADLGTAVTRAKLYREGDNIYTPKIDEFKHIYSLINDGDNTIMAGKVQMFEVAK